MNEDAIADALVVPGTEPADVGTGPEDAPPPVIEDTADGESIARPEHVVPDPFERLEIVFLETGDLDDHTIDMVFPSVGFHTGMGLHDVDFDGDLDLFVGASVDPDGDAACIYRNDSVRGAIRFARNESWCIPREFVSTSVAFIPSEGPPTRMVLAGRDQFATGVLDDSLTITTFEPSRLDPDAVCDAVPNALIDLDLDGDLEVWMACQGSGGFGGTGFPQALDFILDLSANPPARVHVDGLPELEGGTMTLGTGVLDLNSDGLLDVVTIVDTLSTPRARNTLIPAGGTRIRCAPDADCSWLAQRMLDSVDAWGSFMGLTPWRLGDRELFYLADYGPNRVINLGDAEREDIAGRIGADLYDRPDIAFSWSAIPGDFDGDGDDDLYVTQGSLPPLSRNHFARHFDALLTQTQGHMVPFSLSVGIPLHTDAGAYLPVGALSHRGGWRADLDGDGQLELVLGVWEGAPRIATVREFSGPAWCTLVPRPRYVPTAGYGDHVVRPDGVVERHRVQGQSRFAVPTSLVTRHRAAQLRFASGATVSWTCSPGERVVVAEPEWLFIRRVDAETIEITVTPEGGWPTGLSVAAALRESDGSVEVLTGGVVGRPWTVVASTDDRIMLRIDGRWVGRWFEITEG